MKRLSIFFTDTDFVFVEKRRGFKKIKEYGTVKIPKGYIVNGIIEQFDELHKLVEYVINRTKISTKKVNLLLHEKIVSFKKYPIPEVVKKNGIQAFLETQFNVDLVLPFSDPVMDVKISDNNGQRDALIFAASKSSLNSYIKLLESVGLSVVKTDVPSLAAHRAYSVTRKGVKDFEENVMFVNVYKNMLSINIFNNQYPVFSIVSDIQDIPNGNYQDFAQAVQDEIYRMNNYYVWNVNKGETLITKAIIVPMTGDNELDENIVRTIIDNNMTNIEHLIFYNPNEEDNLYDIYVKYILTMSNSLV